PISTMRFASGLPNAPGVRCPGQNIPSGATAVAVPVPNGTPAPGGALRLSAAKNCELRGGQSYVCPCAFAALHTSPARSPAVQRPATQCGHDVRYTKLSAGVPNAPSPVARFREPEPSDEITFRTHAVTSPPTSRGRPARQRGSGTHALLPGQSVNREHAISG